MDLDKQVVNDVKDLFDIKYDSNEEPASTEGMSSNFADLENEVSSVISNMDDKGEALDTQPQKEEVEETVVEQKEKVEETELETIDDLIANSVEEAKALTTAQDVQAVEDKKVEEEQLIEDFDSIEVNQVDVKDEVVEEVDISALQTELDKLGDKEFKLFETHFVSEPVQKDAKVVNEVMGIPAVLADEDIDIIPQKDSEGNIKGELRMKNVVDISLDDKGKTIIRGGEIVWNSESPCELYDSFYDIKNNHINTFSGGEQLDFDSLYAELFGAKVDTSTEVLDQYILVEKMDAVIQCIERVAMIQVQINQQHFVWKRFVELLRGALARVQYLKPVLKQDGLILEHMGDIEFYSDRLAAIRDSADKVMKTLEKAFESLSRKVSIMLTVQSKHTTRTSPDAYSSSSHQTYQEPPPAPVETVEEVPTSIVEAPKDMGDYDSFEIGATVKSGKPKAGAVAWGDVW